MPAEDVFSTFTTFEDIFALALARAAAKHFTADPLRWHKALHEISTQYRDRIPELQRIYFTLRPPLPPQSEQVDQLIKVLNRGREVSLPNPDLASIHMHSSRKKAIEARESQRLAKYAQYIPDISRLLSDSLAEPDPEEELGTDTE